MIRILWVGLTAGILFCVLDGFLNANPFAQRLYSVYKPIAKPSVNIAGGVGIDLVFGVVMAGIFLLLYHSLPGQAGWLKGLSYGVLAWFFRIVMTVAAHWVMFDFPVSMLGYTLVAGLFEMTMLGILYGLTLRPLT